MKLALAAAVALVLAAPAAAADRRVAASGQVGSLALAGPAIAYTAGAGRGCHEVRVWNTADRSVLRYARPCLPSTSTGSGVAGVAAAGRRALWLTFAGGNIREWSLWTATRAAPRPRLLRFVSRDVDAPPPLVLGTASETALPYALDRTVISLAPDGARRFAWEAPERVAAVTAGPNGYAVVLAGGDVVTLNLRGESVRRHPFAPGEVLAATLGAPGLIVHRRAGLLIRKEDDRELALPAGARFLGFAGGIVAYGVGGELQLLRLRDERHVVFRRPAPGFLARLDRLGLTYASGRTVSFAARASVASAF